MNQTLSAILLSLLTVTMSLAGCLGGNDNEPDEYNEPPVEAVDDWQVHFANAASDLPDCNENRIGWLYYVSEDQNFLGCTTFGWELIDVTGPPGADGADGANGVDGQDGQDGMNGTNGVDGQDGLDGLNGADGISTLINAVNSTSCVNGGTTFEIGSDDNADGVLSVTEVKVTVDICNGTEGPAGADGTDGVDGINGTDGQDGANGLDGADGLNALVSTTTETAGSNCANGGIRIDVGVDDNDNGVLDSSEIDQTTYICDGANGSASPNTMLTSISTPSLQACSSGGRIIAQGLDNGDGGGTAQNGVLEAGEVDYTTTYCSNFAVKRITDIKSGGSAYTWWITVMGTRLYFQANDGSTGDELWAHETKNSSTWQVADIYSGIYDSDPEDITVMGTRLYFSARTQSAGRELWAHETTNDSTWQVADIRSGSGSGYAGDITVMGTRLYFEASDGSTGLELWAHETTNGSTWQVADINSGSGHGMANNIVVMGTRQ